MTPPGKCDRILRYGGIAKWLRQRTLTPSPLVQIQLPLPKSSRGAPRVPLLLFDRGSKDGAVACVQASWFTFPARRSASLLARRRARESSSQTNTQLPQIIRKIRGAPQVPLLLFDRGSKDGAVACMQASWFTFTARRSVSSLARRRARESSSQTNTQLPLP